MKVKRRRLLLSAAGAAASASAAVQGSTLAAGPSRIAGVVEELSSSTVAIRTFRSSLERVELGPATTFSGDRRARLADFSPGDEVVAELLSGGPPWKASHLTILYTITDARLEEVTSEQIVTSAGALRVDRDTAVHPYGRIDIDLPLTALRPGVRVHVMQHPSPTVGGRVASAVFIA